MCLTRSISAAAASVLPNVVASVAQSRAGPLERVLTVVRHVLNACDDGRVQDLEHDRGQSRLRHRCEVGVDLPGHASRTDQSRVTCAAAVDVRIVVTTGALLEIGDYPAA